MKTHSFSGFMLFGCLVTLFGVSILAEAIFNINIPFMVFVGVFFVFIGIRIIFRKINKYK
ncbi:MAG: hypothetical protein A2231_08435 [Candidatus Firestonebacteria bacterium RIFOXYA2_FULL_40_8]|nr:MAG: hypothetical protein A2231_08435 [Candidatus Firestonebacteria bacterium RIFOXYA2_FULL_40_8]